MKSSIILMYPYFAILHEAVGVVLPFEQEAQNGRVAFGRCVPEGGPAVVVETHGNGAGIQKELNHCQVSGSGSQV